LNPIQKEISDISLLIPFENSNDPSKLSRSENKFAHFYAGALIALEDLEAREIPLNVHVYDTYRNRDQVRKILNKPEVRNSDVIVGPYDTDILKSTAAWGIRNEVPVVSPWRSSSSIAEENLYYYQVRPLIEQYFEAILNVATSKHSYDDVYIINKEAKDDDSKVRAFQKMYELINKGMEVKPLQRYDIVADSISNSDYLMFDTLFAERPNVALIVPNYSSREARYVYSLVRKINAEVQDRNVTVYGMPTLFNSDRLDLEFFKGLKLVTVDFKHIDVDNPEVRSFTSSYFNKYGHLPTDDSFHGYDTMISLANSSLKASRSSEVTYQLPLLSMEVDYQKYFKDRLKKNRTSGPPDFMVNSQFKVIEFINSRFVSTPLR